MRVKHLLYIRAAVIFGITTLFSVAAHCVETPSTSPVAPLPTATMSVAEHQQATLLSFTDTLRPLFLPQLAKLYAERQMQLIWTDEALTRRFQQQLSELALTGIHAQFDVWLKQLARADISPLARDIILTDALLGYLDFAYRLKEQGRMWLYSLAPYSLAVPPANAMAQLRSVITQQRLAPFIDSLALPHPYYPLFQAALHQLLADTRPWPQFVTNATLKPQQSSNTVLALREILPRVEGWMKIAPANSASTLFCTPAIAPCVATSAEDALYLHAATAPSSAPTSAASLYDLALVNRVKRFQQWQGLKPDGIIGKETRYWLQMPPQQRAAILALNMQRFRLLAKELDDGIVVNIADAMLAFYRQGKLLLTSKTIVGRPDRRTPLIKSILSSVVLNPPWNVPDSMLRKDLVPKMKHDTAFLQRQGYVMLSGWRADAEVIDPATVDWARITPSNFPFRLLQEPGANNALGRYKFNMPSTDAIYLHDTPNHALFSSDNRALSSGCVRVDKAAQLADILLQEAGWSKKRTDATLLEGKTRYVAVRSRIPVMLYYLTAWVNSEGEMQFRKDIYHYDQLANAVTAR